MAVSEEHLVLGGKNKLQSQLIVVEVFGEESLQKKEIFFFYFSTLNCGIKVNSQ